MKPSRPRLTVCILWLALAASACFGPPRPYESLGPAAGPLRAQFNRDAGHPRVVMLVAPT